MSSVIITVVVVLGIIVAGGFLLYFMSDLFISLSNRGKDQKSIEQKFQKQAKDLEESINKLERAEEIKKDPEIATILYNNGVVEDYSEEEQEPEVEEEVEEEEVELEQSQEEPDEEVDDTAEFIKRQRMELMKRLAKMQAENNEEEEEEEEDSVDLTEEIEDIPEEKPATIEETRPQTRVSNMAVNSTYEENKNSAQALASNLTLEELEAKLIEEQDRLKANEKELRQCKKEYLPLRRIKRTLENDEKKLRRKEALVAKQKTVLYGVNNYADIDEEKAKKLDEDLDLLQGLKLSVEHCQEVMDKNSERYPLLEKIFNLLNSQNAEIKTDIKNIQEAIDSLKNAD